LAGDNRGVLASEGGSYCVECGARLEPSHRFCPSCGTARWTPPEGAPEPSATPPHPLPTSPPASSPAPPSGAGLSARRPATALPDLGLLPWLYAAGAVFFLVWATQALAYLLAPSGRLQLTTELARQGVGRDSQAMFLLVYGAALIGVALVAVGLHAAAFYGLRRRRWWGWLAAVVVAGFWSLLIVGIPVLLRLVSRNVREAFEAD
jgi:hypothetical protein